MQSVEVTGPEADRYRWGDNASFWAVHVAALIGAILIGWSWAAFAWLGAGYAVRMFGATAGYHRYFAHRTYRTGRAFQFVLAFLGSSAAQKGVLWWAAHHRRHHKFSDQPEDVHSPRQRGWYWSHLGWFLVRRHQHTDLERVKDLARYPELRFLNRHHLMPAVVLGAVTLVFGGLTGLVWGTLVATVATWHATFAINSLAHVWGRRRYRTTDDSRNNPLLAALTFGEGWHNNHHHYPGSARQGFYWWEVDVSYAILKGLEALRLVHDVRGVPRRIRDHRPAPDRTEVPTGPVPAAT